MDPSAEPARPSSVLSDLADLLLRHLLAGRLEPERVLPVLRALPGPEAGPLSRADLLVALSQVHGDVVLSLRRHVESLRLRDAQAFHELTRAGQAVPQETLLDLKDLPGPPPAYQPLADRMEAVESAISLLSDRLFLRPRRALCPRVAQAVDQALGAAWGRLSRPFPVDPRAVLAEMDAAGLLRADPQGGAALRALGMALTEEQEAHQRALAETLRSRPLPPPPWAPPDLDERLVLHTLAERFSQAEDPEERRHLLDAVLAWPTDALFPVLEALCAEPWAQERALLCLTLRFGNPDLRQWSSEREWIADRIDERRRVEAGVQRLIQVYPAQLFLIWYTSREAPDPVVRAAVEAVCVRAAEEGGARGFFDRWEHLLSRDEAALLRGPVPAGLPGPSPEPDTTITESAPPTLRTPVPDAMITPAGPPATPAAWGSPQPVAGPPQESAEPAGTTHPGWRSVPTRPELPAAPALPGLPAPPAPPPRPVSEVPALVREHLQSFFAENWYLVLGLLMVVAGASLLAYFTWDKHWLIRYTIMPALLLAFTAGLAGVASWLEKKDRKLLGSGAMLRGAAVLLLPVNFMAVALLSQDPSVPSKLLSVPVMAAAYLGLFGYGLYRWCGAVHRPIGGLLAGTLLLLNSLVVLKPLAAALTPFTVKDSALLLTLGVGFYLGFGVVFFAVVRFARDILDEELCRERRVLWFFGGTLLLTYLEVFAWVHGDAGHVPRAHTYAPLLVLFGALVLFGERRFLELRAEPQLHAEESFLGFAFILLGALMSVGQPYLRVLCFTLAGGVWLYQAFPRRQLLHHTIGLTFLLLGGAAVALWPGYPRPLWQAHGIVLALGFLGLGSLAARRGWEELRRAALGMHASVLLLSAVVAVLAQWHFRSPPLYTAAVLLVVAALYAYRAQREQDLRWVHTAMVVLAGALPYLGCVDLSGRSLHGNTMVFGLAVLSLLWLVLCGLVKSPLLLRARSTVLCLYGALGVAGMLLRVVIEGGAETSGYLALLDLLGPLLLSGALLATTYYTRSWVPAGMAALIVVVLFPELRESVKALFPALEWGTGLGSALSGLGLLSLCFYLREAAFLKDLGEGDLLLGQYPLPLRRHDHTLFTGPLLLSVLFLVGKADLVSFLPALPAVPLKTAVAFGLTGVICIFLAVFFRHRPGQWPVLGVHLGWLCLSGAFAAGYVRLAAAPDVHTPLLVTGLLVQGMYWLCRFVLAGRYPFVEDLFCAPLRGVLRYGSLLGALGYAAALLTGPGARGLVPAEGMLVFLLLQLCWHGLSSRRLAYGSALFILLWAAVLGFATPGTGPLWIRLIAHPSLAPTLWLLMGIQLSHLGLEWREDAYERVQPLLLPAQVLGTLVALVLALAGLADGIFLGLVPPSQQVLLIGVALLTARAHGASPLLLLAVLLGYELAHYRLLGKTGDPDLRLDVLLSPIRLGLLGLVLAGMGQLGRVVFRAQPRWLVGRFAVPSFGLPGLPFVALPAALVACVAVGRHALLGRSSVVQLGTPYLGTLTLSLVAWSLGQTVFYYLGGLALVLGNVLAVRLFLGPLLLPRGLSEVHLVCLGFLGSLLQGTALQAALRRRISALQEASLALATLLLALLATDYFTHPDLMKVSALRFAISGAMAYLTSIYFRQAARNPGPREAHYVAFCEGAYHVGLSISIWCVALLFPWFRRPATVLLALGMPAVYFYLRAELSGRDDKGLLEEVGRRYRSSSAVLSFALLGLYLFRGLFQMVLLPETRVQTAHYHQNAPYLVLLSLLLLRLHGLGGTMWLAFYGGLGLCAGAFFSLTALPSLSPFSDPLMAAFCAVGLAHFFIAASTRSSPLRSWVCAIGGIDDPLWLSLQRGWAGCLLLAVHAAVVLGVISGAEDEPHLIAPLLLGLASVVVHVGARARGPVLLLGALLQVLVALHAGFVVPSYLPRGAVLWVLLLLWGGLVLSHQLRRFAWGWVGLQGSTPRASTGPLSSLFFAICMAHVFYHHPGSVAGLLGVAAVALLSALTPVREHQAAKPESYLFSGLLLLVPSWLVYFSQAPPQLDLFLPHTWPVLCLGLALCLTGLGAQLAPQHLGKTTERLLRHHPRLYHQALGLLQTSGVRLGGALLAITLLLSIGVELSHYDVAFARREAVLLCAVYAVLAAAWFRAGQRDGKSFPYLLAELCLLGVFSVVRRQLMLTSHNWSPEYDVWAGLMFSVCLAGAKQVLGTRHREAIAPIIGNLIVLPVLALGYTLLQHLGTNTALMVVGLHSLIFAFLGKDSQESPYNLVAIVGFVAFILIVFASKLQLHTVHAYVIPVGLGILLLLHLFRQRVDKDTRNRVRLGTLLAMLGSTGYYALLDQRYPVIFNLTLLGFCLLAMGVGSFLRIRLYVVLGFTGVVVDLASIVVKLMLHVERGVRMSVVGLLVLLAGIALVGGAAYFKTHREAMTETLNAWRRRLGAWE